MCNSLMNKSVQDFESAIAQGSGVLAQCSADDFVWTNVGRIEVQPKEKGEKERIISFFLKE